MVRALLAVGRQIAAGEVVGGQTLLAGDSGAFESHEKEALEPAYPGGPRRGLNRWQR